jgi:hypothetical protein
VRGTIVCGEAAIDSVICFTERNVIIDLGFDIASINTLICLNRQGAEGRIGMLKLVMASREYIC